MTRTRWKMVFTPLGFGLIPLISRSVAWGTAENNERKKRKREGRGGDPRQTR